MFFGKKKKNLKSEQTASDSGQTVEDHIEGESFDHDTDRLTEFDIEGLDVYAIHYNPETKKTLISYSEKNEDFEFDLLCTKKQHNQYVKRLSNKLKKQNCGWTIGDTPNKDGDYLVQVETSLNNNAVIIKTLGRYCKSGYSDLSGKWKLIGFCQTTYLNGNVIAYKNID